MKYAIVATTIFPIFDFLKSYTENIDRYDHKSDVTIIIVGDRKTPPDARETVEFFTKGGFDIQFLDIEWQIKYLVKYPDLFEIIPENSDNRRNVGFLFALEQGAEVIISVDDDNFPLENVDFVGEHSVVNKIISEPKAVGEDGWFNIISLLETDQINDKNIYPRGFPYSKRKKNLENSVNEKVTGKVGINAGLWLGDPDVDAIGRLHSYPIVNNWKNKSVLLSEKTYSPINTQNTAISREAMVAYYYVRMGTNIRGMNLDRYGDIFSGYFVSKCAKAVGDYIRVGSPIAKHIRNKHNLFVDLYNELAGMMLIEDISIFLEKLDLPSSSYFDAYVTLSHKLEDFSREKEGFIWESQTREYVYTISHNMRIWADIVKSIH
jgi:hypothetical protein